MTKTVARPLEKFLCLKDLSQSMGLSTRSVKAWWERLEVPPTIPGYASHRWSPRDANRLINRWERYWKKRNQQKSKARK